MTNPDSPSITMMDKSISEMPNGFFGRRICVGTFSDFAYFRNQNLDDLCSFDPCGLGTPSGVYLASVKMFPLIMMHKIALDYS